MGSVITRGRALYKLSKTETVSRLWVKLSIERNFALKELLQFHSIINLLEDDDTEFTALHSAV